MSQSQDKDAAHTPGPWEVGNVVRPSNFGDKFIPIIAKDEIGTTRVAKVFGGNLDDTNTCKANARLIAAAPETAAELERVKAQCDAAVAACKIALNDINTARRHAYTGSSGNPNDMTFDAIENSLEPSTRLLQAAIAAAEKGAQS